MNSKQKRILATIFSLPVPTGLHWKDLENLLVAIGCETIEGRGSRVRFQKNNIVATFHRPHPDKFARIYQIKDARNFLQQLGISPDSQECNDE